MTAFPEDNDDLIQATIDATTLAAQLWFQDMCLLADTGDAQAQAIVDMNDSPEGSQALWLLITHINHALSSCAFNLAADDAASSKELKKIALQYPQTKWAIEQQFSMMPLDQINPELEESEVPPALRRLEKWLFR